MSWLSGARSTIYIRTKYGESILSGSKCGYLALSRIANAAPGCYGKTRNVSRRGTIHADASSSQQFALATGAVALGRARRALRHHALSAATGSARAEGSAGYTSARQVACHYRQWQKHRRVRRDRRISHRPLRQRPPDPAAADA